jgi:hypothetical protein
MHDEPVIYLPRLPLAEGAVPPLLEARRLAGNAAVQAACNALRS